MNYGNSLEYLMDSIKRQEVLQYINCLRKSIFLLSDEMQIIYHRKEKTEEVNVLIQNGIYMLTQKEIDTGNGTLQLSIPYKDTIAPEVISTVIKCIEYIEKPQEIETSGRPVKLETSLQYYTRMKGEVNINTMRTYLESVVEVVHKNEKKRKDYLGNFSL